MTAIEWTQRPGTKGETWNPVVGCRRVSKGCERCYAETMARRLVLMGMERYQGLVSVRSKASGLRHTDLQAAGDHDSPRWTGEARCVPEVLHKPLRWRDPRTIFVNSMSDLFHEDVPFDFIAAVYGIAAACPQHTFIILTKRPERALEFYRWLELQETIDGNHRERTHVIWCALQAEVEHHPEGDDGPLHVKRCADPEGPWPLPNVWLGVSCEDQQRANERIPLLLQCPAAVRFVSAEPLLGPIDFFAAGMKLNGKLDVVSGERRFIDWIIAGGESAPWSQARPLHVEWMRDIKRQCEDAGVAFFGKQLGTHVRWSGCSSPGERWPANIERAAINDELDGWRMQLHNRKGGDMSEWPEDLRVREFPEVPGA